MRSLDFLQLKILLRLYNYLYKRINFLSVKVNNGVHPKHRIMDYHSYFLNEIEAGSKVLDIGCGIGALTYDLAKKAKSITGIDTNRKAIQTAKTRFQQKNIEYVCADATIFEFKDKFDYIILSNVLEHIMDRVSFLNKVRELARFILIRVPLINRSWLVLYQKQLNIDYRLDPSHYIEYTYKSFKKELDQAGLKIISHTIQFGEIWAKIESL